MGISDSNVTLESPNEKAKPTRYRPDTFISVRISSPALLSQLSAVQSELNQSDPSIARTLIAPSGFHLTLLTLYTADTMDNISTAIQLIDMAIHSYRGNMTGTLIQPGSNNWAGKLIPSCLYRN